MFSRDSRMLLLHNYETSFDMFLPMFFLVFKITKISFKNCVKSLIFLQVMLRLIFCWIPLPISKCDKISSISCHYLALDLF